MTLPDEPAPTRRQRAFYTTMAVLMVVITAVSIGIVAWVVRREPSAAPASANVCPVITYKVYDLDCRQAPEGCTVTATTADGQTVTFKGWMRVEVEGVPIPTPGPGQR